jgi:hypothetical protein
LNRLPTEIFVRTNTITFTVSIFTKFTEVRGYVEYYEREQIELGNKLGGNTRKDFIM